MNETLNLSPLEIEFNNLILNDKKNTNLHLIAKATCSIYSISINELRSKSRLHSIAIARHNFIVIAYKTHLYSYRALGVYLNNRDHSTMLHGVRAHNDLHDTDKFYRQKYQEILELIKHYKIEN